MDGQVAFFRFCFALVIGERSVEAYVKTGAIEDPCSDPPERLGEIGRIGRRMQLRVYVGVAFPGAPGQIGHKICLHDPVLEQDLVKKVDVIGQLLHYLIVIRVLPDVRSPNADSGATGGLLLLHMEKVRIYASPLLGKIFLIVEQNGECHLECGGRRIDRWAASC